MCGRRVMATGNSIMRTQWRCWAHRRCMKRKKLSETLAQSFACARYGSTTAGTVATEKLCDDVETVKDFCNLGDRLNTGGGSKAVVTARTKIGWVKFRECGEVLYGKHFSLRLKEKVYQN